MRFDNSAFLYHKQNSPQVYMKALAVSTPTASSLLRKLRKDFCTIVVEKNSRNSTIIVQCLYPLEFVIIADMYFNLLLLNRIALHSNNYSIWIENGHSTDASFKQNSYDFIIGSS